MLNSREFHGDEFYAWMQQEHDKARVFLKNCGKPNDEYDRALIVIARDDVAFFKRMMSSDGAKILRRKDELIRERDRLFYRIRDIDLEIGGLND